MSPRQRKVLQISDKHDDDDDISSSSEEFSSDELDDEIDDSEWIATNVQERSTTNRRSSVKKSILKEPAVKRRSSITKYAVKESTTKPTKRSSIKAGGNTQISRCLGKNNNKKTSIQDSETIYWGGRDSLCCHRNRFQRRRMISAAAEAKST